MITPNTPCPHLRRRQDFNSALEALVQACPPAYH